MSSGVFKDEVEGSADLRVALYLVPCVTTLKKADNGRDLNDRQKRALAYLVENRRIDNTTYQEVCGTIKRTASRDLSHLVEVGLLERHGEKKGTYYTLRSRGHG